MTRFRFSIEDDRTESVVVIGDDNHFNKATTATSYDDDGGNDEIYSSPSSVGSVSETDFVYSDDDEDDTNENEDTTRLRADRTVTQPSIVLGTTRYALLSNDDATTTFMNRGLLEYSKYPCRDSLAVNNYPPLQSYRDANTASIPALWHLSMRGPRQSSSHSTSGSSLILRSNDDLHDDDIRQLSYLLRQVSVSTEPSHALLIQNRAPSSQNAQDKILQRQQIQREMQKLHSQFQHQHDSAKQALQVLLDQNEQTAAKIQNAELKQHEELERIKDQQLREHEEETLLLEEQQQRQQQQQQQSDELATSRAQLKTGDEPTESITPPRRSHESDGLKSNESQSPALSKSPKSSERSGEDYLVRANKWRTQLVELEKSVAEYETSTSMNVKKRRLQYKKLVNGRINTLAENVTKIQEVAQDVADAITTARKDDEEIKQQLGSQLSKRDVTVLGKRYLVNLLSSKVIVRVQAEGFNGYVILLFRRTT
jgi:hypothetical protein